MDAPETKVCFTCKATKPVSAFPKNKRKPDGYDYQCKDCVNARIRAAYAKNPTPKIAKTRQYHLDHPEWSRETLAAWHQENAERRAEAARERGKDPGVAAARRGASQRAESRRRAIKAGDDAEVITAAEYLGKLSEYGNRCWICQTELDDITLHWDHYQPLAAGGRHVLANMRPACGPCNIRKNAMWPVTEARLEAIRRAVTAQRASGG